MLALVVELNLFDIEVATEGNASGWTVRFSLAKIG